VPSDHIPSDFWHALHPQHAQRETTTGWPRLLKRVIAEDCGLEFLQTWLGRSTPVSLVGFETGTLGSWPFQIELSLFKASLMGYTFLAPQRYSTRWNGEEDGGSKGKGEGMG